MIKTERIEIVSEPIAFEGTLKNDRDVANGRLLAPSGGDQSLMVFFSPSLPFRLERAEFDPDCEELDFGMVQVGNVLCCPFAKRHPLCPVAMNIAVMVTYGGKYPFKTRVKLIGLAVVGESP